jgi:hypothetical protein
MYLKDNILFESGHYVRVTGVVFCKDCNEI